MYAAKKWGAPGLGLVERMSALRSRGEVEPLGRDLGTDELRAMADRFFWAMAGFYE